MTCFRRNHPACSCCQGTALALQLPLQPVHVQRFSCQDVCVDMQDVTVKAYHSSPSISQLLQPKRKPYRYNISILSHFAPPVRHT
jgi:hypothetical protein